MKVKQPFHDSATIGISNKFSFCQTFSFRKRKWSEVGSVSVYQRHKGVTSLDKRLRKMSQVWFLAQSKLEKNKQQTCFTNGSSLTAIVIPAFDGAPLAAFRKLQIWCHNFGCSLVIIFFTEPKLIKDCGFQFLVQI